MVGFFSDFSLFKGKPPHSCGANTERNGLQSSFSSCFTSADWMENSVEKADVTRASISSGSPSQAGLNKLGCVNKLRSPILVLDFPRSGESSGGGLAPHHWHFSHPVFVMTGLRITEVPFVKYRTIELFYFQRTEFYRKSSEVKPSEKSSLYLRAIENGQKVA